MKHLKYKFVLVMTFPGKTFFFLTGFDPSKYNPKYRDTYISNTSGTFKM